MEPYSPTHQLLNREWIKEAVIECLENDDFEGIAEVIRAHLEATKICRGK